jgi:hypothetical protein
MHPRLVEIAGYLEESRAVLLAAVAAIPEDRRAERASENAWTAGEVIDHLALVEDGVARLLERRAERGRAEGLGPDPETSSILGCLDDRLMDRTQHRFQAHEVVRPRSGTDASVALASLAQSRLALVAAMRHIDGLDLGALRARHPALGEIDLYQWLVMVAKHERRHAQQLEELRESLAAR